MEQQYIVYKTTNLVNNKYYIGVHHVKGRNSYLGSGKLLKQAINKYGKDKFKRETLFEYNDPDDAYNKEKELVTEDVVNDKMSYNLTLGGGKPPGYSGKDHYLYGKRGKEHPCYGTKRSLETRLKMSRALKGKKKSPEHVRKMSIARKGKHKGEEHWNYGRVTPEKVRKKIGAANKGKLCKYDHYIDGRAVVEIECHVCGKKVFKRADHINSKKDKKYYCSLACNKIDNRKYKLRKNGRGAVEVTCDYCGKKYLKRIDNIKERNYCTAICNIRAKKELN